MNYPLPPLALLSEVLFAPARFSALLLFTTLSMLISLPLLASFLDKLLPHMLYAFLSPTFVLHTTRTAKKVLFPNGYPGPQPIDPTVEEQAELRRRLVGWRAKRGGGSALLAPLLLGPDPEQTLEDALEPLSNSQCNKHLVVFLLDRILLGLFPELGGGLPPTVTPTTPTIS